MANSLMIGASKMRMDFVIAAPKSLWPEKALIEECKLFAKESKEQCYNYGKY